MNAIDRGLGSAKPLTLYGVEVASRLLLGTSRYPSPQVMSDAARLRASASSPSRCAASRRGATRARASSS